MFHVGMDSLTRSSNLYPITVETKQFFKKHWQVHPLDEQNTLVLESTIECW